MRVERLAASYALNLNHIDATLGGMATPAIVKDNINTAWFALTPQEFRVRETILARFLHRSTFPVLVSNIPSSGSSRPSRTPAGRG